MLITGKTPAYGVKSGIIATKKEVPFLYWTLVINFSFIIIYGTYLYYTEL